MDSFAVIAHWRSAFGRGRTVSPQQRLLLPPIGHGDNWGHVGIVEIGIGGYWWLMASGNTLRIIIQMRVVIMMIVLNRGRVHLVLPSSVIIPGSPVCLCGFNWGTAGEGQDLQWPLGDSGQVRVALIRTDMVNVVSKKTTIALQREARNQEGPGVDFYKVRLLELYIWVHLLIIWPLQTNQDSSPPEHSST